MEHKNRSFFDECRDAPLLDFLKKRCRAFFQSDAALQPEDIVDDDAVPLVSIRGLSTPTGCNYCRRCFRNYVNPEGVTLFTAERPKSAFSKNRDFADLAYER